MKHLRVFVEGTGSLEVGGARVFEFQRGQRTLEGFVLHTPDGLVAFANECPHWYVDLDLGDRQFYDERTGRIICRNHGALFHPRTGVCELGPCVGMSLEAFELSVEGDGAWVTVPDARASGAAPAGEPLGELP